MELVILWPVAFTIRAYVAGGMISYCVCRVQLSLIPDAAAVHRDFSTSCITDDNIATLVRMPNVAWTPSWPSRLACVVSVIHALTVRAEGHVTHWGSRRLGSAAACTLCKE